MNRIDRRAMLQWLGAGAATAALGTPLRLYAAPDGGPRLLFVFLRGGYDCANVLIPYSSADYYELRKNIAVARPKGADAADGAIALDADWALAPALRETIGPLYKQGQALFIPFAGTDDLSRSHFETQDHIELGLASGAAASDLRSGFMARLASTLSSARPIAFTDSLPVCFRGASDIPNISLKSVGKPVFDARQSQILSDMYAGHRLQAQVLDGLELRATVSESMAQEMQSANRDALAPKGFELEARRVARLMRDTYGLGFIDVGGWDTHVNQGADQGALASNLESLGRGLQAFAQEMGPDWRNTVVVVVSEFGRTFRENGNKGTDHGHGSVHWVLGGSIHGGRIAGEQVRVSRDTLFQGRDFPVLNDYRAVLGGVFQRMWGLSPDAIQQIFPQAAPLDLQIV